MSGIKKLYLQLSHGRDSMEEDMDDWGFEGPYIGPLTDIVQDYESRYIRFCEDVDLTYWHKVNARKFGVVERSLEIPVVNKDLTPCASAFYGYYSVGQGIPKVIETHNKKLLTQRLAGMR